MGLSCAYFLYYCVVLPWALFTLQICMELTPMDLSESFRNINSLLSMADLLDSSIYGRSVPDEHRSCRPFGLLIGFVGNRLVMSSLLVVSIVGISFLCYRLVQIFDVAKSVFASIGIRAFNKSCVDYGVAFVWLILEQFIEAISNWDEIEHVFVEETMRGKQFGICRIFDGIGLFGHGEKRIIRLQYHRAIIYVTKKSYISDCAEVIWIWGFHKRMHKLNGYDVCFVWKNITLSVVIRALFWSG